MQTTAGSLRHDAPGPLCGCIYMRARIEEESRCMVLCALAKHATEPRSNLQKNVSAGLSDSLSDSLISREKKHMTRAGLSEGVQSLPVQYNKVPPPLCIYSCSCGPRYARDFPKLLFACVSERCHSNSSGIAIVEENHAVCGRRGTG